MKKLNVLKDYFGFTSFRIGQEGLIDNILKGRDTLGIMPTGAGKSLCFQLPALMFDGITLVVSPLISLMKDQVGSLTQAGISAAYINSSLNHSQYIKALQNAKDGRYKIIYVAPERLTTEEFIDFAQNAKISMVTIDEAHCVSQWGQDFRPSYLIIPQFINRLADRPVLAAFTATATPQVREDVIDKLNLKEPYVLTTGFDRKNLFFSVQKPKDKFAALKDYIERNKTKCGIVYCSTRKTVDEVCRNLIKSGFAAVPYHAGLSEENRRDNQDSFIYDKSNIMVATNAFGMGIDKSNISYIIHYNMPKNIESYYQEAGRAGRDGEPAECLLFYGGQDVVINQLLIDNSNGNEDLDKETIEAIKEKDRELLKIMTFYCHTNDCLREYILNYFGEKASNYCGNCSNCNTNFEEEDVTIEAQKIMSCIKRVGQRFGIRMIVDILRGSKNQRIINNSLNNISTYGVMSSVSESRIRDVINFLVLQGYLEITNSEYPVVQLTHKAVEVLFGDCRISMKVQKHYKDEDKPAKAKTKTEQLNTNINEELFERLRLLRSKIAQDQQVPAYIVFADAALRDMCIKMPKNSDEFLQVNGVGQVKLERYGKEFLEEINS
ncbi:DNA helicase RecQ [Lutispora sp.]|uniref:DNA helicase RecQ n=1 Tax=Lutispora sp. TaxID=2828727 RepID=UPI002B21CC45|nr:DNA helicase RecQ [Lutispora sp.]MEA4960225.1 DNA helicase RecQ [Lutispora sp.]